MTSVYREAALHCKTVAIPLIPQWLNNEYERNLSFINECHPAHSNGLYLDIRRTPEKRVPVFTYSNIAINSHSSPASSSTLALTFTQAHTHTHARSYTYFINVSTYQTAVMIGITVRLFKLLLLDYLPCSFHMSPYKLLPQKQ